MNNCLYIIRHKDSGRVYVGSTINPKRRWKEHVNDLNNRRHGSPALQNAWNKYGSEAFEFEIVKTYANISRSDLFEEERVLILAYQSELQLFNSREVSKDDLKFLNSPEIRARISERVAKMMAEHPEHYANLVAYNTGKVFTLEERLERSKYSEEYWADPENRKRKAQEVSELNKDQEHRRKIAEGNKTPQSRQKNSSSTKSWWATQTPERRAEMSRRIREGIQKRKQTK